MSKWKVVKDNAALSPRPLTPGSAIAVPGGRVSIAQIEAAIGHNPFPKVLDLIASRTIYSTREINVETLKVIAKKRLQQAGRPSEPANLVDYLTQHRDMLISGLGCFDRRLNSDDFFNDLSPLDVRHSRLFNESMSPISNELSTLFTLEVGDRVPASGV